MKRVDLYAVSTTKVEVHEYARYVRHRGVVQANDGCDLVFGHDRNAMRIRDTVVDTELPIFTIERRREGRQPGGEYDITNDSTWSYIYVAMTPEMTSVFDQIWAWERGRLEKKVAQAIELKAQAQANEAHLRDAVNAYRALPWYTRVWAAIRGRELQQ